MINEAYISKIENIVDRVKNAIFEIIIKDIQITGNDDDIAAIMEVQDETGTIKALLVGEREEEFTKIINSLKIYNKYRIRGDVSILNDELINGKTLVIKAIDKCINYDKCIKLVSECAKIIPEVKYVGWDIAITENGASLIEGNCYPGIYQIKPSFVTEKCGLVPIYEDAMKIKIDKI